ncbi:MAG: sce7726 family protein [Rhodothermaceae bacterium]|nr:sce7726 family protein [Rhodothermaceae bacterium]
MQEALLLDTVQKYISANFVLCVCVASLSATCNRIVFTKSDILDPHIREALVGGRSGLHDGRNGELVVHELGLAHAKRRVDVAVIDDEFHGYEIKSERDTLDRLKGQLHIFSQALHKLTLVVATKHLESIHETVPAWCGITEVRPDSIGRINLNKVQEAKRNPEFDPYIFAHLLWRNEAQSILSQISSDPSVPRGSRTILYKLIVENTSDDQLTGIIKKALERRNNWRDHLPLP